MIGQAELLHRGETVARTMSPFRWWVLVAAIQLGCVAQPLADAGSTPVDGGSTSVDGGSIADAGATDAGGCLLPAIADAGLYTSLEIALDSDSTYGVYDPSLAAADDAGNLFMSYSSVPALKAVHTRLAGSTNAGASWTYLEDVNEATPLQITTTDLSICDAGSCAGTWVHEVSSLVIDATDPDPMRRFKVFTHSYFATATQTEYQVGNLSLFTSPGPDAGWAEEALLGWNSSSPTSSMGVAQNISSDPALAGLSDCIALTEPGALLRSGALDLSVACITFDPATLTAPIDARLIRSTDHGASWTYVSTPVSAAQAATLGASGPLGPQASGTDLFAYQGNYYLSVSPNGPVAGGGNGYRGCWIFQFDDIDAGSLVQCDGLPAMQKSFGSPTGGFSGPCTFVEQDTSDGLIVPMADLTSIPVFAIFASHQVPR
jgi:hypothetical protein